MPRNYVKKSLRQANNPLAEKATPPPSNTTPTTARDANKVSEDRTALQTSCASVPSILVGLESDPFTTAKDKYERAREMYAKWKHKDIEEPVEGADLLLRQKCRIKDIDLVIFGFSLHEAQIEAIWTLFYERRNLFLLAKTGFGKSLIFQLLPFMIPAPTSGVVLVLMPFKLLQSEQSDMINRILHGKAIVLNGENNQKRTQQKIANEGYTHVFTSPKIALSKKFVLDQHQFTDRLYLLAIDEIHLVEEWGKSFRPLYADIQKVRKRIPCHVPLLGVSATLTKKTLLTVIDKAEFLPTHRLMRTSLDRHEIMQIHRFIQHSKGSCLDLQFVLPRSAFEARDIQKTVIFVNSINDIRPAITIIQAWMQKLGYPDSSSTWIRPYYATMSDWDKDLTAKAFRIPGDENLECTILVATDAYGMGIDNPDVRLVIQWDIPFSFDTMIQRMGRAGRKGALSTFVLFTPKWSMVKDPKEIEERLENRSKKATSLSIANAQLSDSNRPKPQSKTSPLCQVVSINNDNDLDNNSVAGSEAGSEAESEADSEAASLQEEFDSDLDDNDDLEALLATEAGENSKQRKKDKKAKSSDAAKRARMTDEIFDYIHVARCRRLFSLAWYDDLTYASKEGLNHKPLPLACCNGPSCKIIEPDYMQREPFISTIPTKLTKSDREWIACRTAALRKWRSQTSTRQWLELGVNAEEEDMPDSAIMSGRFCQLGGRFG